MADDGIATITQTNPLLDNQAASQSSAAAAAASADSVADEKNQFLQMLITQLKNQDPLSPMDTTQFTNQMMMMGQLEQLFNLNESVGNMAAAQQGSLISQYSGLVGKDVLATGNQFQIAEGSAGELQFYLPETPADIEVNVFDKYGNLVRDFAPTITTSGDHEVEFDGKDSQGTDLPTGYYTYTVSALNQEGNSILATTYSQGKISSIRLDNGSPVFQMGDKDVGVESIKQIF